MLTYQSVEGSWTDSDHDSPIYSNHPTGLTKIAKIGEGGAFVPDREQSDRPSQRLALNWASPLQF